MTDKRHDNKRAVLKPGESQRKNGTYDYRWIAADGKRHSIYAKTLRELRILEKGASLDKLEGIQAASMEKNVNDIFDMWCDLKRGLKRNTLVNYKYMYNTYVRPSRFAKKKIANVKKSDIKAFYNMLYDDQHLKTATIDNVHTVLHQVFSLAVDDNYLRNNPADNALKELKQAHNLDAERRAALTLEEEEIFLGFLKRNQQYNHWYPLFKVMLGTGARVGEVTGLRWQDVDLENGTMDINHTLVYFSHEQKNGCYFGVNSTKTPASKRVVMLQDDVVEAFRLEKKHQQELGLKCKVTVDGYTDFIFVNRFGECQHNGTINKAINRIVRDCNDEILTNNPEATVLLPHFSSHSCRHSFTTRMVEAGVNLKVIQTTLGHSDISTTMNIYADVTDKMQQESKAKLKAYYEANTQLTPLTP